MTYNLIHTNWNNKRTQLTQNSLKSNKYLQIPSLPSLFCCTASGTSIQTTTSCARPGDANHSVGYPSRSGLV